MILFVESLCAPVIFFDADSVAQRDKKERGLLLYVASNIAPAEWDIQIYHLPALAVVPNRTRDPI